MSTCYSATGKLYLNGELISDSCRMSVEPAAEATERPNVSFGHLVTLNSTFGKFGSKGHLKVFGPQAKTYAKRITDALEGEGNRYMGAWWTGGNPYMASGKAKRIGRLMRIHARARRLEGV